MGECLICHERPVANAPDAAACGVCMLADLRRIMSERSAAEEALAAARRECADLKDHLRACVRLVDAAGLLNLSRGVQLGATSWYVKATDAFDAARAALAAAAGEERK